MFKKAGEYNIHFIMLFSSLKGVNGRVLDALGDPYIAGKCDEDSSRTLFSNKIASKGYDLKNGYFFIKMDSDICRAKIYTYNQTREIAKREFVM